VNNLSYASVIELIRHLPRISRRSQVQILD